MADSDNIDIYNHGKLSVSNIGSIFLTGGTGFFGKWLLDYFRTLKTQVIVLSRNPARFTSQFPSFGQIPNVSFIQGDIRSFSFPTGNFDYVIHAATEASDKLDKENPDEMYSVIVDGTQRVLEFSRQAEIKRLLYISSGAVYGIQSPELSHVPETYPCNPVTAYGKGKLEAEQMCLAGGVETVIARCFAFVGPWLPLDAHFAIGNFIHDCLFGRTIKIKGDGTPLRSYLYTADLAVWLWTILLKGRAGGVYNVGSDSCINIEELARLVKKVTASDVEIEIAGSKQPGLPVRYVPDIDRARADLELDVWTGLEDAIKATYEFYKSVSL